MVEVKAFFEQRGWITSEMGRENIVPVTLAETKLLCIDGRNGTQTIGVKLPGAVYGVMDLENLTGEQGMKTAIDLVKEVGLVPTVHGDDHKQEKGCGFRGLNPQLGVEEARGRQIVEEAGGEYVGLEGHHDEVDLIVNDVPMTLVDTGRLGGEHHFVADLWFGRRLGLPVTDVLEQVASTIEKLGGHRNVRIIK